MILCGMVCGVLVVGVLFLYRRPIWPKIRNPCRLLFVFALLGCLAALSQKCLPDDLASGQIARRKAGEGDLKTEAYFRLEGENTKQAITLTVEEKSYRKAEEEALLAKAIEEIDETFCGENASLEEIVSNPVVCETYQEGQVLAQWLFSESSLISSEGEIFQSELKKETNEITAFVTLSCGTSETFYRFSFWIVPKARSKWEQAAFEIQEAIAKQDTTKSVVTLPTYVKGQKIEWSSVPSVRPEEILGLGILAVIAVSYVEKEKKEKQIQKRKQNLLLAYPEFVSKLSLLLGAGMTISGALRKMNQLYQKQKKNGGRTQVVYEELYGMICEMENGKSELRAYQTFSEKCDLQPYRKLVSLLVLGQRVGNRKLTEQLKEEADRVFLERKNAARKLGEEAGTKLLFPMMLMLVIVMGIVMVPAFLSIYGI